MEEVPGINSAGGPLRPDGLYDSDSSEYVRSLEMYLQLLQREVEHLRNKEMPFAVAGNKANQAEGAYRKIDPADFYNCTSVKELAAVFDNYLSDLLDTLETEIFIVGSDRKIVQAGNGEQQSGISAITRRLEEEGLIDWVIDKKEITFIPDIYDDNPDVHTNIIVFPLFLKGSPTGVIVSRSGRAGEPDANEKALLNTVSEYIKFALDNINSAEEIRKMNARLSVLNMQMNRTNSYASLGELTASILKEIEIPIEIIKTNVGFIESGIGDTQVRIDLIKQQLANLSDISRNLTELYTANESEQSLKPVNLASALEEVLLFSNSQLKRDGIVVEKTIEEPSAEILAVRTRIEQALLSLLISMRDNMPDGGIISFGLFKSTNRRILLSIADNGPGMSSAESSEMFEPGQAKWNSNMALVKNIVESMKGKFELISEPGKGTTCKLLFQVYKY